MRRPHGDDERAGTDKRGQGGAKATIVSSVSDAGDGATRVEVVPITTSRAGWPGSGAAG